MRDKEQTFHVPSKRPKPPEDCARDAGFRVIAGVDEAGRGPWAGPVVAAAVLLPASRNHRLSPTPRLSHVRIDDSKRLSPQQRLRAYQAIVEDAVIGVGIVPADVIDTDNILQATFRAMQQAVADLSRQPELILVDGPHAPQLSMPCWPILHGDQLSYPIACASIVAKVTRDALMAFYHRLFPHYRFDHHKGYGTALHALRLARWGPSLLHRMSFQPISRLLTDPQPASQPGEPIETDDASSQARELVCAP